MSKEETTIMHHRLSSGRNIYLVSINDGGKGRNWNWKSED